MYESNHNDPIIPQVADFAAQWGADQELEACVEWFQEFYKTESWVKHDLKHFRAARRPQLPSLKEQVLAALDRVPGPGADSAYLRQWSRAEAASLINDVRRALEQLDD
jgi:hypothetical protein